MFSGGLSATKHTCCHTHSDTKKKSLTRRFGLGLHHCPVLCSSSALGNWGFLVCSLALHEVPKGLERRCLDASGFSRWDLVYLNIIANVEFGEGETKKHTKQQQQKTPKPNTNLMWLLLHWDNSELPHLSSLILKCCTSELAPFPYKNSCRVQNMSRKLTLPSSLFPCVVSCSFSRLYTPWYPVFLLFWGVSLPLWLLQVMFVFSIVAAVWTSALQYFFSSLLSSM